MAQTFPAPTAFRPPTAERVVGGARRRVRHRRRSDLILLAVAALLIGTAGVIGAAIGSSEQITAMWAGAEISPSGSGQITEVIDWDFGVHKRHGIYRDVPGLAVQAPVTVSSATAPDRFEIVGQGSETRIRVGDPSRTVRGRHRYRIGYPLDGVAPGRRLAWNAVGTRWPVQLSRIEVHLVAPFELTALRCVQGTAGSQRLCELSQPEPGHLVAVVDRLGAYEGVTLYASGGRELDGAPRLQPPASGRPTSGGAGLLAPGWLAAVVALLAAVPTAFLVRRAGRERVMAGGAVAAAWAEPGTEIRVDLAKLSSLATIEFSPPEQLTPAEGGVLLAETVRDEHKVAWLIGAAADGYLDIESDDPWLVLVRRGQPGTAIRTEPWTRSVLDDAFGARDRLALAGYDRRFAMAWAAVHDRLTDWQKASGMWDPAGDRRCGAVRAAGAVGTLVGLLVLVVGGMLTGSPGAPWQPVVAAGAVLAGAGAAALICSWELRIRTPAGSGLWLRTESFRRFLAESEAHHVDQAAARGMLLRYTAWAVALGQVDRWSQAVARSSVPPTDPAVRYPTIADRLPAAAYAASNEPPSPRSGGGSSDRGFSGGSSGGVGGGSGGGGGGSW